MEHLRIQLLHARTSFALPDKATYSDLTGERVITFISSDANKMVMRWLQLRNMFWNFCFPNVRSIRHQRKNISYLYSLHHTGETEGHEWASQIDTVDWGLLLLWYKTWYTLESFGYFSRKSWDVVVNPWHVLKLFRRNMWEIVIPSLIIYVNHPCKLGTLLSVFCDGKGDWMKSVVDWNFHNYVCGTKWPLLED